MTNTMQTDEPPLISTWQISYSLSPHAKDSLEMEAAALLDVDLTEALPFLNAELTGARYTPKVPALIWMFGDHQIGILKDRIVVDHVHEDEDPTTLFEQIAKIINRIWTSREAIEPRHTPRTFRQPLEIFALLPQTNCRLCGEATCYSYALKLTAGVAELTACKPLFDPHSNQEKLTRLQVLLQEKDPTQ